MDQKKIGLFLKELRKEKDITQEILAEELGVSSRTVSRWETGSNMPDISLLVQITEIFDVTIPEIINGERKSETMEKETKEVAEKMADYATEEKEKILKDIRNQSIIGVVATLVLLLGNLFQSAGLLLNNVVMDKILIYCETLVYVMIVMIFFHATGLLYKMPQHRKMSNMPKTVIIPLSISLAVLVALILKLFFKIVGVV